MKISWKLYRAHSIGCLVFFRYEYFALGTNVHDQYICALGMQAEAERLRTELRNTVAMYNQACENLVHAQAKVILTYYAITLTAQSKYIL